MIRLVALLFAMSMAFAIPQPCAHAGEAAGAMDHAMAMPSGHGDHSQHDMASHADKTAAPDMPDCPSGCDGGPDCQGCTMMTSAVLPLAGEALSSPDGVPGTMPDIFGKDADCLTDGPPPRTGRI